MSAIFTQMTETSRLLTALQFQVLLQATAPFVEFATFFARNIQFLVRPHLTGLPFGRFSNKAFAPLAE